MNAAIKQLIAIIPGIVITWLNRHAWGVFNIPRLLRLPETQRSKVIYNIPMEGWGRGWCRLINK